MVNQRKPSSPAFKQKPVPGFSRQPSRVSLHRQPRVSPLSGRNFPMATPSSTPAAPAAAAAAASVPRLSPLRPSQASLHRLRLCPAPSAAAAAASPISRGPGCRPLPSIRCRAAAGPPPPSSEPPTPSGWQERLSSLQDRARIFFAVLFWMSLFFWGSAWDGSNNSGGKKRQRFRKKSK
ncbi:hypothetical protein PAHAL_9G214700 [Panicum hallii]|uniref:Uncharacterized protein n=2 Tax=Panicum hallii TaxID=206008 RepID=A0A2T8I201_9POAL|nr:hypothetical protein PAHAL_9G214700 [Panicum hallii]